ncbi:MAG: DUF1398 family protein [Acidobacteria bacterium]|nr:DUF1398 family protein [Acidobacteriota bacterium]
MAMRTDEMEAVMRASQAGEVVFPEVVRRLVEAGVESYFTDFVKGETTFHGSEGGTHTAAEGLGAGPVAGEFSSEGVVAAIRAAQADAIRFPEFMRRAKAAGVAGYWAFLAGRKVVYFGRKGEMHVEEFPR